MAIIAFVGWRMHVSHEEEMAVKTGDYGRCWSNKCAAAVAVERMRRNY